MANNEEMIIPEGFPVSGNIGTLSVMQPLYKRFVGSEKFVTCAIINALTINLLPNKVNPLNNSNFLVTNGNFDKTWFLDGLIKGNPDNILRSPSKHSAIDLCKKDDSYFDRKTIVNYDFAITSRIDKKPQLPELISFYAITLSDGEYSYYDRNEEHIKQTDYNILFYIEGSEFIDLYGILKSYGLLERVVPIYHFPTYEEMLEFEDQRAQIGNDYDNFPPIVLPYLDNTEVNTNRYDFEFTEEMYEKIIPYEEELQKMTKNSIVRCHSYITKFLASNALINDILNKDKSEKCVVPDDSDLKILDWVMPVHNPLKNGSFDEFVYNIFLNNKRAFSVIGLLKTEEIVQYSKDKNRSYEEMGYYLQSSLDYLTKMRMLNKNGKIYYAEYTNEQPF